MRSMRVSRVMPVQSKQRHEELHKGVGRREARIRTTEWILIAKCWDATEERLEVYGKKGS